jgi:hypothetical protein
MHLSPVESEVMVKEGVMEVGIPANAFVVYKVTLQ